jgi:hypothetical protein
MTNPVKVTRSGTELFLVDLFCAEPSCTEVRTVKEVATKAAIIKLNLKPNPAALRNFKRFRGVKEEPK